MPITAKTRNIKAKAYGMGEFSGYAVALSACEDRQYPQGKIKAGAVRQPPAKID